MDFASEQCPFLTNLSVLKASQSQRDETKCLFARLDGLPQNILDCLDVWHDGMLSSDLCPAHSTDEKPKVPAGIFMPTIGIGACLGRAVGLITYVPTLCLIVQQG